MNFLSSSNSRELSKITSLFCSLPFIQCPAQMSQSGWICSLTISNAENLWGFLFCTFSPRCLPNSFGIISFCSSLLFVRIGIIHPNIRREKRLFGRRGGGNQSPVNIVWLHICPFHSALLKVGPVGCDGPGLCSTEHLSLPAEPGLPSELNRKMTKWWQRNGSQFQVELPPLRTHGIVFSDGASTTSSRSLQRLMIWRLESCPNAQASSDSSSGRVLCWERTLRAKGQVESCEIGFGGTRHS